MKIDKDHDHHDHEEEEVTWDVFNSKRQPNQAALKPARPLMFHLKR